MASSRNRKEGRAKKDLKSRPVREIPFEYEGRSYLATINHDSEISFTENGKEVSDPLEQNRLMEILLMLNKQN